MFTRLAKSGLVKFRFVQPRRIAPGPHEAGLSNRPYSNDNLPSVRRPRGPRRIRSQALVCHWSLIDGGTRLGCRWHPAASAQTAPEDPDSERSNNQTFQPQAGALGVFGWLAEPCVVRRSFIGSAGFHITVFEPSYRKRDGRNGSDHGWLRATGETASKSSRILGVNFFSNPDP